MPILTKINLKTWFKPFSCALIFATTSLTHAQTCNTDSIPATTPDNRFEIISGGREVKDKVTGLIWQRCSVGQTWNGSTCTGSATVHTWQQALKVAKDLGNGYRLPNIKELNSIVERQCDELTINSKVFPNTANGTYWSSSPKSEHNSQYPNMKWVVSFYYGHNHSSAYSNPYVRAVRSE